MNGVSNVITEVRFAVDGSEDWCVRNDEPSRDPYITIYLQNIRYVSELVIVFENYGKGFIIEPHHAKTCLRDFRQVTFKPECSATEASLNLESLDIASIHIIHIILSKQRTTKVLFRLRGCAG